MEIHQLSVRNSDLELLDYVVFDLDPPEDTALDTVIEIALHFKEFEESHGYHLFAKPTGSKGLHQVASLEPDGISLVVHGAQRMPPSPVIKRLAVSVKTSTEIRRFPRS